MCHHDTASRSGCATNKSALSLLKSTYLPLVAKDGTTPTTLSPALAGVRLFSEVCKPKKIMILNKIKYYSNSKLQNETNRSHFLKTYNYNQYHFHQLNLMVKIYKNYCNYMLNQ